MATIAMSVPLRRGNHWMQYANDVAMNASFELPQIDCAFQLAALVWVVRTAVVGTPTGFTGQELKGDWPGATSPTWGSSGAHTAGNLSNQTSWPAAYQTSQRIYAVAGSVDLDSDWAGVGHLGGAFRFIYTVGTASAGAIDIAQYWVPFPV